MGSSVSTLTASGKFATGTAAGTVCTLLGGSGNALSQPGIYKVNFYVGISGTPTTADDNNIGYACGSNGGLLGFPGALGDYQRGMFLQLNGSDGISITTNATNAGAYSVLITADFLGRFGQLAKYFA